MFDIGWTELMVIGVVALIVVGPKDLPGMFRTLGKFTAKAKSMAREFTRAMEDAADESGVKDVAKGLKDATSPTKMGLNKLKDAANDFTNWDPTKKGGGKDSDEASGLSEERAEAARKIQKATAAKATKRLKAEAASEAAAKTAAATGRKPAAKKPAAKKPAAKPAKTPTAKKPAAKKPGPKKPTAKPAKAPAAKKTAAKPVQKAPAKKAPAKKATAKKPAAKGGVK